MTWTSLFSNRNLSPSLTDKFWKGIRSFSFLEAITLKKFVISSNCPTGPKEILQNGKYGFLFKAKNYIQLSKLILKYSNNKKKYKNKIIHGYKSLERFNLDNNCRKYYNEIVKYL